MSCSCPFHGLRAAALITVLAALGTIAQGEEDRSPRIAGMVVDARGAPVPGARLSLIAVTQREPVRCEVRESTQSDGAGAFRFAAPFPSDRTLPAMVFAKAPDGGLAWSENLPVASPRELRLSIEEVRPAVGRVIDPNGQPLSGVQIVPQTLHSQGIGKRGRSLLLPPALAGEFAALSAADGTFSIPGVPPSGGVDALVLRAGCGQPRYYWNAGQPVELELAEAGALVVRLEASEPQALAGVPVQIRRKPDNTKAYGVFYYGPTSSDAHGIARFEGAPPGSYQVQIGGTERDLAWESERPSEVEVTSGKVAETAVKLVRSFEVIGRVEDAASGAGIRDARVIVTFVGRQVRIERPPVVTDAEGRFRAFVSRSVPAVSLRVEADGFDAPAETLDLQFNGRAALDAGTLSLARAREFEGTVRDEAGNPVPDAQVFVIDGRGRPKELATDAQGRFRLSGLRRDGLFALYARRGAAVSAGGRVVVPSQQQGEIELTISPQQAFRLRGRVVDQSGAAMAGLPVELKWQWRVPGGPDAGLTGTFETTTTDQAGRYESSALWPGEAYFGNVLTDAYETVGVAQDNGWRRPSEAGEVREFPDLIVRKMR